MKKNMSAELNRKSLIIDDAECSDDDDDDEDDEDETKSDRDFIHDEADDRGPRGPRPFIAALDDSDSDDIFALDDNKKKRAKVPTTTRAKAAKATWANEHCVHPTRTTVVTTNSSSRRFLGAEPKKSHETFDEPKTRPAISRNLAKIQMRRARYKKN